MARGSKKIGPLFPIGTQEEKTESKTPKVEEPTKEEPATVTEGKPVEKETDHQTQDQTAPVADDLKEEKEEPQTPVEESDPYSKYKKKPKYLTHVPHNTRIPKELRKEMERIAKKLGVPLGKNSGFFQEFTIDALWEKVKKTKKELGIDD